MKFQFLELPTQLKVMYQPTSKINEDVIQQFQKDNLLGNERLLYNSKTRYKGLMRISGVLFEIQLR